LKLDGLKREIEQCLKRCVVIFESSGLMSDRNASFDELTASLGDDLPPRVGFDGWQRLGKSGYRATVISLFTALNDLAQTRLLLREAVHIGKSALWLLQGVLLLVCCVIRVGVWQLPGWT
jgi:hypothetical protein